ncbi:hypothetical protein Aperf_G00000014043 [Anoplocephala perfoliata]
MEPILKRLESIESKLSALNERDAENQRLLAELKQVKANFELLYHTSRSEIANLKRNLRKDLSNSNTNRLEKLPTLDPRRPISKPDLIVYLHSASSVAISQIENSTHSSRHTTRRSSTLSSSSDSSSVSSSSGSSPLSSGSSQHRSRSRPQQKHLQKHPSQNNRSHSNLNPEASSTRLPVDLTKHLDSRPIKKCREVEAKHVSTDVENGVSAHLMRLVSASIRSAREHHAYSIRNAPPSRGYILNAEEQPHLEFHSRDKSVVDPHHQADRSSSNSAISPSKASVKNLQSTSPVLKIPGAPKTPEKRSFVEEEEEYDEQETTVVNVGHGKARQDRKAEVEVITEEESASGGINEASNNHADSPQIDIEEDVSDVDSHIDANHGEAMSEGEVKDEVDDDTMGDCCRVEANSNNHNNLQHRSVSRQQDRSRKRHPEPVRYETSRGRRNMPSARKHRAFYRNDDSTASPRSLKRARHLDDEPYARQPNRRPRSDRSSPRRGHFGNSGSRICRNRAVSPVVYRTSAHRSFNQRH